MPLESEPVDNGITEDEESAAPPAPAASDEAPAASSGQLATDTGANGPLDEEEGPHDGSEPETDWQDLALRKAAELENVRKQTAARVQKATRDGMKRVALELMPALDDFERALAHAEAEESDQEHTLTKGIRLVQQQMLTALQRVGIEAYSPLGELFDPHRHEAVASQPVEGTAPGTIVEVYQQGYRFGDDVLRAAKVVVAA